MPVRPIGFAAHFKREVEEVKTLLVRTLAALAMVAGVLLVGVGTASAHGLADSRGATAACSGGVVAPGTYSSLTITGMCAVPTRVSRQL